MSDYGRLLFNLMIGGFFLYLLINGDIVKYAQFAKT